MVLKLFIVFVLVTQILAEQCITPNNEVGDCLPLYSCLPLINALGTQDPLSIDFVRLSNCGGTPTNPLICCGSSSNFTVPVEIIPEKQEDTGILFNRILPDRTYCGYQHSDDYYHSEDESEINEFPWLALLLYKNNKNEPKPKIRCSGSLISPRYVLTAAHCLEDVKAHKLSITGIRLGDYNINNKTDCVDTTGIKECSDPVEEFEIEKVIIHPKYDHNHSKNENDIALIRLNRTVTYTDYIHPICLPLPGTKFAEEGDTLLMTGWGDKDNSKQLAEIKKVQSKLISDEECADFQAYGKYLTKNHFCTKDVEDNVEFSCKGDTGGPVIFSNNHQWYQEGVISFSAIGCGTINPNVHTKVKNYLDWIQASVEP